VAGGLGSHILCSKPGFRWQQSWLHFLCASEGGYKSRFLRTLKVWHTFRRFKKEGWRGYIHYIFNYTAESVYSDHLSDL
jgi:hypothetical protein